MISIIVQSGPGPDWAHVTLVDKEKEGHEASSEVKLVT